VTTGGIAPSRPHHRTRRPDRTGQKERRHSHSGRTRLPDLRRLYRHRRPAIHPGAYEFTFDLLGSGRKPVNLDKLLDSATWTEDSAIPQGHLTVRRPDPNTPRSLIVEKSMLVRCRTRPSLGGRWVHLWTMRVLDPQPNPVDGVIDFDVSDDLSLLSKNKRNWVFRKTKKRKKGYTLGEVARAVCRKEGIKPGRIYEGKHRLSFTKKRASGLDVLRYAAAQEKSKTGGQLNIKLRNGYLDILPLQRNRILYEFKDEIETAVLQATGADDPVTVIQATGHIGKGKKGTKVKATVQDRAVVRRLGRVVDEKDYGHVKSRAELMQKARRDLAKGIRQTRTADIAVRGIPYIHRGEGVRWITREPGWYGKEATVSRDRSFVFTTAVSHTVSGADFTTQLSLTQVDPFVKDQEARDAARRKTARSKRKSRRSRRGHK
jgi:hypothetical protein